MTKADHALADPAMQAFIDMELLARYADIRALECLASGSVEPMEGFKQELHKKAANAAEVIKALLDRLDETEAAAQYREEQHLYHSMRQVQRLDSMAGEIVTASIGEMFDPVGYFIYILWGDDAETPLYVGQSTNILARLGSHMADREKRRLTKRIQILRCTNRFSMEDNEARLIRYYRPLFNITGNLVTT